MSGNNLASPRAEPSATEWLVRLRQRELSARELAAHYLDRIDRVNTELNAVVALNPERTLADADRADDLRARNGSGPLLGLPVTIKDSIDVEGFSCTAGSYAREGRMPSRDATVVERLRSAGAVVLGKTNVPEYIASFETDNAIYGRTNNPHHLGCTPGGSSGGEAAILAADASPAGIGSDGGGSIRVPAHYCGIVGFRPTVGRVPETGAWPSSRSGGLLDVHAIGPMTRFVEDAGLLLGVITGPDWIDPYAVPVPLKQWSATEATGLRIGFYTDDPLARPTPETSTAVEHAAILLAQDGNSLTRVTPPACVSEATELFFALSGADGGARMRNEVKAAGRRHHPQFESLLEARFGQPPPTASSFFETLERMHRFRETLRHFVNGYDILLCPVVAGAAPPHGQPPADLPAPDYFRYESFNYTHTYSLAGLPVAVVQVGADQRGLPIGIQIVAPAFADHTALAVAKTLERLVSAKTGAATSTMEGAT